MDGIERMEVKGIEKDLRGENSLLSNLPQE